MSNLTAQQVYERTRGKDSPENVEKRNLKAFGHKSSDKKKRIAKKMKPHVKRDYQGLPDR